MKAHSSISTLLVGCLIQVAVALDTTTTLGLPTEAAPKTEAPTVVVSRLPEPFNNKSLPIKQEGSLCWEYVGCIEPMEVANLPIDPMKMKAAFQISNGKDVVEIRYEETKVCLKDGTTCRLYPFDLSKIERFDFDSTKRTIITSPGWTSDEFVSYMKDIAQAWHNLEQVNTIVVAWTGGSKLEYPDAASSTKTIGRQITVLLYYLAQMKGEISLKDKAFSDNIYYVGHSLGSHISAFSAKDFGGRAGMLMALDPAGPFFEHQPPQHRLQQTDAQLVLALHTNGGHLGLKLATGHLDFFANDGTTQPGCSDSVVGFSCSHSKALSFYQQSLEHEHKLRKLLKGSSEPRRKSVHANHRLFAHRSQNYDQFQNGYAFLDACPLVSGEHYDFEQSDLRHCIVPMDFVTPFEKYRRELIEKYSLDLDMPSSAQPRLFFFTEEKDSYLNNHYLMKVAVSKESWVRKSCAIQYNVMQSNGFTAEYIVDSYVLLDRGEHYEIVAPLLAADPNGNLALADLDLNDFFLHSESSLQDGLVKSLPRSISLKGYFIGEERPVKKTAPKDTPDWINPFVCHLDFKSVRLESLNKLGRFISAWYDKSEKKVPDIVYLGNQSHAADPKLNRLPIDYTLFDHFDTVYLSSVGVTADQEFSTRAPTEEQLFETVETHTVHLENASGYLAKWIVAAVSGCVLVALVAAVAVRQISGRQASSDRQQLV